MTPSIACAACLEPGRSVHTATFRTAVALAREMVVGDRFRLTLFDDGADAKRARAAARAIVATRPACVVGHFASAAADAAAPIYAEAGLPLVLPAATMTSLTRHPTVYRACDNDEDYAAWLASALDREGLRVERMLSDQSPHGESVVSRLGTALLRNPRRGRPATVFSGRHGATLDFLRTFDGTDVVLTDDADAPGLARDLVSIGLDLSRTRVHVAALRPRVEGERGEAIRVRHRAVHGTEPGAYFWETIAAIELATSGPLPPDGEVMTVLGPLAPDAERECRPHGFRLERVASP